MPTFGYPDTSEKFQDNLDLLEVIIQKLCLDGTARLAAVNRLSLSWSTNVLI
jgi:hypothetical protein